MFLLLQLGVIYLTTTIEFSCSRNTRTVCTDRLTRAHADLLEVVAAVSGAGGATLRTFDVSSGHLLSEKRLHNADAARLLEPDITGLSLAFDSAPSTLYVLTNGHIVRRVDADTGEIRWGWTASDQA